jgi:hypothetical protein
MVTALRVRHYEAIGIYEASVAEKPKVVGRASTREAAVRDLEKKLGTKIKIKVQK